MFSGIVSGDIEGFIKTSSHALRGTSRQQSEDFIYNQIDAFERLLQHSMSRFSKENLYHMLRHVTRWAEGDTRNKLDRSVAFKLNSIDQLRKIVESAKHKRKGRNSEDDVAFKHYDLFLNDILYLKDLKKYFEDEIYKKLKKHHSDPSLTHSSQTPITSYDDVRFQDLGNSEQFTERSEDRDSGRGSQSEMFELKHDTQSIKGKQKHDCQTRFIQTGKELDLLLRKWNGLLTDDNLELNDFDPDSYHELMQFSGYSQFEPLLRLIPDIFAKCFKCIDLSKRWLEDSNVILKDLPITSTPIPDLQIEPVGKDPATLEQNQKEYLEQIEYLTKQLHAINKTIEDGETQLTRYNDEMDVLVGRDERYETVSTECNKLDSLITIAAGNYQKSKTEQYALASKLRGCSKGSPTYAELKSHLKRLDTEVSQNHWRMKLLEFEKVTVQEDYLVEMEVRPSFIRFVGDTKDKMQDLENLLHVRKEEKLKLEKQLALTKTNTDRTRQIMRSYLGSASFLRERSRTFDSIPASPTSDIDDPHDKGRVDGNEADDDSSGPIEGKENIENRRKISPSDSGIMKTPRLVKNKQTTKRDLRPYSEGSGQPRVRPEPSSPTQKTVCSRGPRAALKSQPKRVWEFV